MPIPRVGAIAVSDSTVKLVYNQSATYALPGLLAYAYEALGAERPEPSFRAYPKAPPSPQEAAIKKQVEANVQSGIAPMLLIYGTHSCTWRICV